MRGIDPGIPVVGIGGVTDGYGELCMGSFLDGVKRDGDLADGGDIAGGDGWACKVAFCEEAIVFGAKGPVDDGVCQRFFAVVIDLDGCF